MMWETLIHDLRYTIRTLLRSPGFALTAVLVTALGIGANTAAFSVADYVLIRPLEFRSILAIRRTEFIWALAGFAGVMLLGTLRGILAAIVLSLLSLAQQAAEPQVLELGRKRGSNVFRPRSAEHPDDETFPGLLLVRLVGRLFFANYQRALDRIRALVEPSRPRVLALDLSGVIDLEYTALKMLTEAEGRARERGVTLWLVGLTPEVLAVVQRSPLGRLLGRERMFFNLEQAVASYLGMAERPPGAGGSATLRS